MWNKRTVLLIVGSCISFSCFATAAIQEQIEYQAESLVLYGRTEFPQTKEYLNWLPGFLTCSAMNQGAPVYRVVGDAVHIVAFQPCGSAVSVHTVNPKWPNPMIATWIDGSLKAMGGKPVCLDGWIWLTEWEYEFNVSKGRLTEVNKRPNPLAQKCIDALKATP